MPLFGRNRTDSALLALEALEEPQRRPRNTTLTPASRVTDELKQEHSMRASLQLVPEAHPEDSGGDELERGSSAKVVADKLASGRRRRWLAMHQEAIDEVSPRSEQRSESGDEEDASGGITPVRDLQPLSMASYAVATAPTPEQLSELSPREVRNMQADAAVAGMSRGRTVYFRTTLLDWVFFLRNEHPLLSCLISHPLHPFEKGAHAKFLAVIMLFGVFTSVMTLHNVCKTQPQGQDCERKLDNTAYQEEIIKWALASAALQMLMQTMAVCPCMQPGGTCACLCTAGCKVCCTKVGQEGLLVLLGATALLTFVSMLIAVNDNRIDTLNVLGTTFEVKIRAFGISFLILTLKFFFFVSHNRPHRPQARSARSEPTYSARLRPPLLTRLFAARDARLDQSGQQRRLN